MFGVSLSFLFATPEFLDLLIAVQKGEKGIRIQGVTDAARPYVLACLACKLPKRLVCVRPPSNMETISRRSFTWPSEGAISISEGAAGVEKMT